MTHQDRDEPTVETANEARQGPKGFRGLWVLATGLVLAILAFTYFMSTNVEEPPPSIGVDGGPVGPSSDSVPNNAEPSRLDSPPQPQK